MVVEGEAVGGAVGVDVKGGRQETGLVPVLTGSRRLDVHVETWNHMNECLSHDWLTCHMTCCITG